MKDNLTYKFKTKPMDHQLEVIEEIVNDPFYNKCALHMEQGTGKTKTFIDINSIRHERGLVDFTIIICPKSLMQNWVEELAKHSPIPYEVVKWKTPTTKKLLGDLKYTFAKSMDSLGILGYLVVNTDTFSTKNISHILDLVGRGGDKVSVVIDECTSIKNPSTIRTKNILKMFQFTSYKMELTGTPITNKPLDIYSQFAFLDPAFLGFSSYTMFKKRYAKLILCSNYGRSYYQIDGYKNLDELKEKISKHAFRILKKDCLDLEDKIYLPDRVIQMSPEQKQIYTSMKETLMASIEGENVVIAKTPLVKILRLDQITSGFYIDEDNTVVNIPGPNPKLNELLECIEEYSGKIVIWCVYRYSIKLVQEALKKIYGDESVVTFYGDNSEEERNEAKDRFNNDDSCRFFISNRTGCKGLTLISSSDNIYYENDYDIETRLQSEDRTHRIGQTKGVTYTNLVVKGTVNEKILQSQKNKVRFQDLILKDAID